MKYASLFALVFTICFVRWLSQVHYKPLNGFGKESLYESPDNLNGAAAYEYYRQRNPATGEIPVNIRKNELAFAATLPKYNEAERSIQWQNRGPYNLGGRTRALALDVTNENIILAGQVTGGMWRSDDGGAHFTQTTQPQQLHSSTCIAQDKRVVHTNVWYYGTGEQYGVVNAAGFSSQFAGDGIFKSTDGGHTWAQLPSTVTPDVPNPLYQARSFNFVWQMVTDSTDANHDVVYAAVVNGIWRSADGGNSWAPVLGLDTAASSGISLYSDIAITSTGVLYATISSETPSKGIYRSTDGINWTKITPPSFPTFYNRIEIGIAPSDESQLYIIAETPSYGPTHHTLWHYKYLSGDGSGAGGQWSNRSPNIPDDHCLGYFSFDFRKYNSQNSYDMFIAVHPKDTNVVFLGGTDLYRSWNGFTTNYYDWIGGYQCDSSHLSDYVYPNHHPDQHRLIFSPSNPALAYSATDGGIMKTYSTLSDVVTWQPLNNNYNTGQFYTCAIEPGNTNSQVIVGGLQDNGTYFTGAVDYTAPWTRVLYGDGTYCAITHNRTNYYLSWDEGRVYKMTITDSGTVTGFSRMDPTGAGSNYIFVAPMILDPLNDTIMYLAVGKSIWRNDSLTAIPITGNEYSTISQGWKIIPASATGQLSNSPLISTIDIGESNPNILYFGTDGGQVYKLDSCRSSTAAQKTDITDTIFPKGAYVSCVEVDRLNSNNVLVTFSNYGVISIFYTSNAGQTWTNVSGNLEENPDGSGNGPSVTWGHIYNDGVNTKYYVGTSIGLFSTSQLNGLNTIWAQEGVNTIGNVVIDMITSRTYDGNIVVATHGNGMYSNQVFIPTAVNNIQKNQVEINCYPNPFHGSLSIEISNAAATGFEADIFDLSGRLLQRLKQINSNRIIWDGKDLSGSNCAAGTYIIRVTVNGKATMKKIVKM